MDIKEIKNYPTWYVHFLKSQELLSEACKEMEDAAREDGFNSKFCSCLTKMRTARNKVDLHSYANIKRGHKEGWL